jgi:hypothetical protein
LEVLSVRIPQGRIVKTRCACLALPGRAHVILILSPTPHFNDKVLDCGNGYERKATFTVLEEFYEQIQLENQILSVLTIYLKGLAVYFFDFANPNNEHLCS